MYSKPSRLPLLLLVIVVAFAFQGCSISRIARQDVRVRVTDVGSGEVLPSTPVSVLQSGCVDNWLSSNPDEDIDEVRKWCMVGSNAASENDSVCMRLSAGIDYDCESFLDMVTGQTYDILLDGERGMEEITIMFDAGEREAGTLHAIEVVSIAPLVCGQCDEQEAESPSDMNTDTQ